jgi:NADH-quinone oxidoreductase subunit K
MMLDILMTAPANQGMLLAAVLFCIGLAGVLVRRSVIFMLMSVEVMLNAAGLAFIVGGAAWGQADGQVMFLFILAMAAAEVSVGLALIIQLYHQFKSDDVDKASSMTG